MFEPGRIIDLPKISDPRGNLTFVEGLNQVPFEIKRVYYLYDVPGGEARGGHAHMVTEQFMIAVSGSFDLLLENSYGKQQYTLNRSYYGVYIPKMTWRELENFSSGAVSLVLASTYYSAEDYIRDHDVFLKALENEKYNLSRSKV